MKKIQLLFIVLYCIPFCYAQDILTVEVRRKFEEKDSLNAKDLLTQEALKELVKKEITTKNLSSDQYSTILDTKFELTKLPPYIKSYEVVDFSREPNDTSVRVLTLKGVVDTSLIPTNVAIPSSEKNIFLKIDFSLENLTWQDLGVAFKDEISKTVEKSWLKWLAELNPAFVSIKSYNEEKEGTLILCNLRLIKINTMNEQSPKLGIDYQGGFVVMNLATQKALTSGKFEDKDDSYTTTIRNELSTQIANAIYRFTLPGLAGLKNFSIPVNHDHKELISYFQFKSPEDVFYLIKQIETKGVPLALDANLYKMKIGEAQIEINYKGDKDLLKNFLKDLTDEHFSVSKNNPFEIYAHKKEIK